MASPISSRPIPTTPSTSPCSGSSGLSAPSPTTPRVADYFRRYNKELHKDFTSIQDTSYRKHFENSNLAILKAAEGLSGTALLLGVGGAHDLPLKELARQFDTIVLVDIDTSLTEAVVARLPKDIRDKFRIHAIDLTGIISRLDRVLDVVVASGSPHKEFCDRAVEALQRIRKDPLPLTEHSASFVVSSLLSSQLSHKIHEYLDKRSQDSYGNGFMRSSNDEMVQFADTFAAIEESHMQDLHNLVAREGRVYFADHFSMQDLKFLHCEGKPRMTFAGEDVDFYSVIKLQVFAQKYFNRLRVEKWDWTFRPYKSEQHIVQIESSTPQIGIMETCKNFHITALTLAPK